jgi:hypothetical protein
MRDKTFTDIVQGVINDKYVPMANVAINGFGRIGPHVF